MTYTQPTSSDWKLVAMLTDYRARDTYSVSRMTRAHKITNLIGVPTPLIALAIAIVLLWNKAIGPLELGLMLGLYVITAFGITLGYHRMFTHRAFESSRAFRAVVAAM